MAFNGYRTILPSAARTATVIGADQKNDVHRGILVAVDVTAVPGVAPSLVVTIEGKDRESGKYFTLLTSAAITAVGTVLLRVYPGLTPVANLTASDLLPTFWRVSVAAGNANSATYSVGATLFI